MFVQRSSEMPLLEAIEDDLGQLEAVPYGQDRTARPIDNARKGRVKQEKDKNFLLVAILLQNLSC